MVGDYLHEDATAIERADYELRRVDHLIYVSLKYTRTVDVIKNIIARLIETFNILWGDFLDQAERKKLLFERPSAPGAICTQVKKLHKSDQTVMDGIAFYLLLRQFNHAEYTSHQEFRRHVTMKAVFPNGDVKELNIDIITEYFKTTKEFVEYFKETYSQAEDS